MKVDWGPYFQCKRKTRGRGRSELPRRMTELGKLFYHHLNGAYRTLPVSYIFVAPRGRLWVLCAILISESIDDRAIFLLSIGKRTAPRRSPAKTLRAAGR